MRPRLFPTAQAGLDHISVTLRRAYPPRRRSSNLRALALAISDLGMLARTIAIVLVPVVALMFAWNKPVDPMADARLSNARVTPAAPVAPVAKYYKNGDVITFKDFPGIVCCVTGDYATSRYEDLPWTGNHLYDTRYVTTDKHWYIWMLPRLVRANTLATPTWIDP
jgi:hypothetical protein